MYVKISPLTRLEGHLGITANIRNGKVVTAWSHGEMFRGFEKILRKRDPRDAPVITSRTCGVCHFVHRHTSLRNIENAAGFGFPAPQAYDADTSTPKDGIIDVMPGGGISSYWIDANRNWTTSTPSNLLPAAARLARNIVHLVTFVYSHAAHLIVLAGPDYKDGIDAWIQDTANKNTANFGTAAERAGTESFFDNFYNEAVVAQRILHEILGVLGGKVPHQMSAIPGGFSQTINQTVFNTVATLATKNVPHKGLASNLGVT